MIPPRYRFRVVESLKLGMNPCSISLYVTSDYTDAAEYLQTRLHLATAKRRFAIKENVSHEDTADASGGQYELVW